MKITIKKCSGGRVVVTIKRPPLLESRFKAVCGLAAGMVIAVAALCGFPGAIVVGVVAVLGLLMQKGMEI